MKARSRLGRRQFQLNLLAYGNYYYIERVARLEATLKRKPRLLQINMVGVGEIPADTALLRERVVPVAPCFMEFSVADLGAQLGIFIAGQLAFSDKAVALRQVLGAVHAFNFSDVV